jgi:Nuclease-related domain
VRLFGLLERDLPEGYTVLHHVRWLQKERRVRDGEADFLILHPDMGALAVEAKGGEIRFDAASGTWTSTSRSGEEHVLPRDPADQAKDAAYSLARYFRDLPDWPARWGPIGYAVSFPDGRLKGSTAPHFKPVLIDEAHLHDADSLQGRIQEIFEFWREDRHRADARGVDVALRALASDITIVHPLAFDLDEADRAIIRLSQDQFRVLDMLAGNRRVAVSGPAGSGKTVLAAEKARRLASEGLRVLFTCFNRPLADHLREALADADAIVGEQERGRLSGSNAPRRLRSRRGRDRPTLRRADRRRGARLHEDWWLPLVMLLEDADGGTFHLFYDDNQAIYGKPSGIPDEMPHEQSEPERAPEEWFEHLRQSRVAAAHAVPRDPGHLSIDPDDPDLFPRLAIDANRMRLLAQRAIERRWPKPVRYVDPPADMLGRGAEWEKMLRALRRGEE